MGVDVERSVAELFYVMRGCSIGGPFFLLPQFVGKAMRKTRCSSPANRWLDFSCSNQCAIWPILRNEREHARAASVSPVVSGDVYRFVCQPCLRFQDERAGDGRRRTPLASTRRVRYEYARGRANGIWLDTVELASGHILK